MVYERFVNVLSLHHRLSFKLTAHGIGGSIIKWIEGFLADKRQIYN